MLIKTIEYTDFNGQKRTEEHAFNLTQAEVIEWVMTNGDYTIDKMLDRLTKERNGRAIIETFKDLIYRSYGRISLDGRRFEKSKEIKDDFMETEAYSQLFTEIVMDAQKAAEFVNGIIPKDMAEEISKVMAENRDDLPDSLKEYIAIKEV